MCIRDRRRKDPREAAKKRTRETERRGRVRIRRRARRAREKPDARAGVTTGRRDKRFSHILNTKRRPRARGRRVVSINDRATTPPRVCIGPPYICIVGSTLRRADIPRASCIARFFTSPPRSRRSEESARPRGIPRPRARTPRVPRARAPPLRRRRTDRTRRRRGRPLSLIHI